MPEAADFEIVDRIIFAELVDGIFSDASRQAYNEAIARLAERGCDAVALACTEIPLLVRRRRVPAADAGLDPPARARRGDARTRADPLGLAFSYRPVRLVSQVFASWNQTREWLRRVEGIRLAA